jgi:hypothetical protein
VAELASPPRDAARRREDRCGQRGTVLVRVPLGRDRWEQLAEGPARNGSSLVCRDQMLGDFLRDCLSEADSTDAVQRIHERAGHPVSAPSQ